MLHQKDYQYIKFESVLNDHIDEQSVESDPGSCWESVCSETEQDDKCYVDRMVTYPAENIIPFQYSPHLLKNQHPVKAGDNINFMQRQWVHLLIAVTLGLLVLCIEISNQHLHIQSPYDINITNREPSDNISSEYEVYLQLQLAPSQTPLEDTSVAVHGGAPVPGSSVLLVHFYRQACELALDVVWSVQGFLEQQIYGNVVKTSSKVLLLPGPTEDSINPDKVKGPNGPVDTVGDEILSTVRLLQVLFTTGLILLAVYLQQCEYD